MQKIRVIIADAQYLIRLGLIQVLSRDNRYQFIGQCANSAELRTMLRNQQVDIVIMDYAQEEFSLEDLRYINSIDSEIKILVITPDQDKEKVFEALKYGVVSFLTKECEQEEILSALNATSKAEKFICNKIIDVILDKQINPAEERDCRANTLSKRELEIIQLTAKSLSAKEIGQQLYISTHTVYTHKKNILKKLNLNSSSEVVFYARDNGIIYN
ncbi:MAG: response regulator transcription factor [Chitinophagales bacterium]|nr:response regulator transcription factor [Chitinophagales bacterium]